MKKRRRALFPVQSARNAQSARSAQSAWNAQSAQNARYAQSARSAHSARSAQGRERCIGFMGVGPFQIEKRKVKA